ncbi:hypothetical protein GCM10020369_04160 [Cryptosporangium minutisporangium]|uniref:Uncharacterized protein n=1 Tax=Cryptosporangium minutisporangium TaxID=113569 RepID=A0ABP6SQK1_9ACTN
MLLVRLQTLSALSDDGVRQIGHRDVDVAPPDVHPGDDARARRELHDGGRSATGGSGGCRTAGFDDQSEVREITQSSGHRGAGKPCRGGQICSGTGPHCPQGISQTALITAEGRDT